MPRGKKKSQGSSDPVEQLIKLAEKNADQFQNELALQFCRRALEINPSHLKTLEMMASLLLEEGDYEQARQYLGQAIQLSPDKGHEKFFSLAQMFEGKDSLECYNKGIDILAKELDLLHSPLAPSSSEAITHRNAIKKELSNAYCSVAEIFMSDLCDEPDAEEQCVANIERAISVDNQNPEALQCKANYLLVRGEIEEAKNVMSQSLSLWLPQLRAAMDGEAEVVDPVEVCSMPYNTRIETAKLLIELEEFEPAGEVLEGLLTEDDENVQVWYLMGLSNYLRKEEFYGNARYYFKKANKMSVKIPADPDILTHINELMTEIGPGEENEDDSDEENDEDKENDEDDDSLDGFSTDDESIVET